MNFRTTVGKFKTCQETLTNVFWQIRVKVFLEKFLQKYGEFSENVRHSWSGHILNCLLTGLAMPYQDIQTFCLFTQLSQARAV